MAKNLRSRLKHAWNVFMNRDPTRWSVAETGYSYRPDRVRLHRGNERSIATSVFNRIAMDVAAVTIQHVRLDENGRFLYAIKSGLNNCLTLEANLDQTGRAFIQDAVISMLDEGCVAIVPVDTTLNPKNTGSWDVNSLRTGQVLEWYPDKVKVRVYNERTGKKEDVVLPKSMVAIVCRTIWFLLLLFYLFYDKVQKERGAVKA